MVGGAARPAARWRYAPPSVARARGRRRPRVRGPLCFPAPTWTPPSSIPLLPGGRKRPERAADGDGARAPGRHRIARRSGRAYGRRRRGTAPGRARRARRGARGAFDPLRVAPIEVKAVVLSIADADGESAVSSSARRRRTTRRSPRSSAKRSTATARTPSRRRSRGPKGGRSCTSRPRALRTALQAISGGPRRSRPGDRQGPRCEPATARPRRAMRSKRRSPPVRCGPRSTAPGCRRKNFGASSIRWPR